MDKVFGLRRQVYIFCKGLWNFLLWVPLGSFFRVIVLNVLGGNVSLNCRIRRGVKVDFPWRLTVQEGTTINANVYIDCRGSSIFISKHCDISSEVSLYTLTHSLESKSFAVRASSIYIANKVWIGAKTVILPGSYLGEGSVVGACSLFKGTADSFELWVGVLAKKVKDLPIKRSSERK